MNPVYKKLADTLDRIPNGFPETRSGVELKILAKLFTPEEAETACNMSLKPLPARAISERMGIPERDAFLILKSMVKKGLIDIERGRDGLLFNLMPFIVGFYERQNAMIDREFAELFEQYYREALHRVMTVKPSVHRVIPVEKSIPLNIEVMPYERASHYLKNARSWGVLKCICRIQKRLIGEGCQHSVENCLVFSEKPRAFSSAQSIRDISRDQAFEILEQASEEGLVHTTHNTQTGINYICNCCTCCCGLLRGIIEYNRVHSVASSEFTARVDRELCTGCGACIDHCRFQALALDGVTCVVSKDRCLGCGLCVNHCPTGALTLAPRPERDTDPPPSSETEWRKLRMLSRESEKKH